MKFFLYSSLHHPIINDLSDVSDHLMVLIDTYENNLPDQYIELEAKNVVFPY